MFDKLQAVMLVLMFTLVVGTTSSVFAQAGEESAFSTQLSGQEEVPPTDSQATGMAQFDVVGKDNVSYSVDATNIQAVTAGHIHSGAQGENGPVVVTLFSYDLPQDEVLETGTFTTGDFEGLLAGRPFSNLIAAMESEQTYVNIHTEQNPDGEIRGQITTANEATG